MKPITRISFESGHVYEVPTAIIQAVGPLIDANWEEDILPHAKLVEFVPAHPDLSTASVITTDLSTQPTPPSTGGEVLDSTIEWLLAVSGAHGQMFQNYMLEANGQPAALISITTGGPAVVKAASANIAAFAEAVNRVLNDRPESTPIQ